MIEQDLKPVLGQVFFFTVCLCLFRRVHKTGLLAYHRVLRYRFKEKEEEEEAERNYPN